MIERARPERWRTSPEARRQLEQVSMLRLDHHAQLLESGLADKAHRGIVAEGQVIPDWPTGVFQFGVRSYISSDPPQVCVTMRWEGGFKQWRRGRISRHEDVWGCSYLNPEEITQMLQLAQDIEAWREPLHLQKGCDFHDISAALWRR